MKETPFGKAFTEWAKRYSENPEEFDSILDEDGKPIDTYGERCAAYFAVLLNDTSKEPLKGWYP